MDILKLIGVVIVIVGFALKFDTLATVVLAGLATGLVAGMSPLEILETLGKSFVSQRTATLFVLTLPAIGICERYGLKEKAIDFIRTFKNATSGRVIWIYEAIRTLAAAFSVRLGGHPQFVRPVVVPMSEGAAAAKYGELTDEMTDTIRGAAAGSENYGNFYAQNCFMASSGTALIVSTLTEQGHEVSAMDIARWSIPIAVISVIVGFVRTVIVDKKLDKLAAERSTK
ncbi:MAG: DUF969 domain-containing protein [Oscillospiraceae bacterium]|nr:DUF969 domain-containing protein [Oscillospiraceae bacterium]MBR4928363.1 DUF969 domain-containing protein [Oscillospiraceae bacterium]MBR5045111.1 DUF969 domain-containing protein [Oscillospiraceae bacterium]MBR5071704.1 DUF969 domain-containing protein [Oscillospiraceae bacterium]MBR5979420.1 DUF969 domain-containing protein [Oscillospiraceae bacterium]